MSRTRLTALVIAATTTLATGCGKSTSTLTEAQLRQKAEPICAGISAKLRTVTAAKKPQDVARTAAEFAAYTRGAAAELAKLAAPSSMRNDWKAIVAGYREAGGAIEELGREAIPTKGKPGTSDVTNFTNEQHYRIVTAQRDGFTDCAQ